MRTLGLAAYTVGVIFSSGCGWSHMTYSLGAAGRVCSEVQFPEWQFPELPHDHGRFVFRRGNDRSGAAILVTVDGNIGINHNNLAANKYRLHLNEPSRLEPVSVDEWNGAAELNFPEMLLDFRDPKAPTFSPGGWHPTNDAHVLFKNRMFQKSGALWPQDGGAKCALASADGGWLVLHSYDGPMPKGRGFLEGGEPTSGAFYVDLFNASTGKKVFTIKGQLNGTEAPYFYGQTGWALGQYLVLQLDEHRHTIVVCDPRKA